MPNGLLPEKISRIYASSGSTLSLPLLRGTHGRRRVTCGVFFLQEQGLKMQGKSGKVVGERRNHGSDRRRIHDTCMSNFLQLPPFWAESIDKREGFKALTMTDSETRTALHLRRSSTPRQARWLTKSRNSEKR